MDQLQLFLYRKSARQRIILYLMARGYRFDELSKMTADELKSIEVPNELGLCIAKNQVLSATNENNLVFSYPNGRKMGKGDFFRILTQASMKVLGRSITVGEFQSYVNKAN